MAEPTSHARRPRATPARPDDPRHRARVVVTGGAGFLGSHLCTALLAEEVEVICLDNFLTGDPANVAHLLGDPGFRLMRCDVTDFVHLSGRVDLVLHFASPASPATVIGSPASPWRTNVGIARPSWGRIRGPYVLKIRTMPVSTPCAVR